MSTTLTSTTSRTSIKSLSSFVLLSAGAAATGAYSHELYALPSDNHSAPRIQNQLPQVAPTHIPLVTTSRTSAHAAAQERAIDRLNSYLPTNPLGDISIRSNPDHVATAIAFINFLPPEISVPSIMRTEEGDIGMYWDIDDAYADIRVEVDGSLSLFCHVRSLDVDTYLNDISITQLTHDWARLHLQPLYHNSSISLS